MYLYMYIYVYPFISTKRKGILHNIGSLGVTVFHPIITTISSHGICHMEHTGENLMKRWLCVCVVVPHQESNTEGHYASVRECVVSKKKLPKCVHMYICIHMCVCVYIYIHIYVYIYVHLHYIYTYVYGLWKPICAECRYWKQYILVGCSCASINESCHICVYW